MTSSTLRRALLILLLSGLAGCQSILPRSADTAPERHRGHDHWELIEREPLLYPDA